MTMPIENQFIDFIKQLEKNNNREWFAEHKKDYERHVRDPFKHLIVELRGALDDKKIKIKDRPEQIILRINRDLRFSKDKTPYNTMIKAVFVEQGRKSGKAGYYLGIDKEFLHVGGGLYQPAGPDLQAIREAILNQATAFKKSISGAAFKKLIGTIEGEQASRLKQPFKDALDKHPYLALKEYIAMAEVPIKEFISARDQAAFIMRYFLATQPLINFLNRS